MVRRTAKSRKTTHRNRKLSRKMTRKGRSRRQRGGGKMYEFTIKTPITPTSVAVATAGGLPLTDLGKIVPGNKTVSFTPVKPVVDIQVMNGTTPYGASSFGTSAATKLSFQIGSTMNLVSKDVGVGVRGASALPGADATTGMSGTVTIKGLDSGSFGTLPPVLTFRVFTTD